MLKVCHSLRFYRMSRLLSPTIIPTLTFLPWRGGGHFSWLHSGGVPNPSILRLPNSSRAQSPESSVGWASTVDGVIDPHVSHPLQHVLKTCNITVVANEDMMRWPGALVRPLRVRFVSLLSAGQSAIQLVTRTSILDRLLLQELSNKSSKPGH